MQVDFFEFAERVKPVKEFGLKDIPPASINYEENQKDSWNAIVECNNRDDYFFSPLDKKIKILDELGNEESLCECLLNTEKTIAFIELKAREKKYTQKAITQIENTLLLYKQNHNLNDFTFKKAYICNRKHPYYNESRNSVCSDFSKRNKVSLHIGINIKELE